MIAVAFVVPRRPVSVNASYGLGKRSTFIGTKELKEYKQAVADNALAGRPRNWPKLESIKRVYVEILVWNTAHDIDAPCKASLDGMEGILYTNDRVVRGKGALVLGNENDGGEPRVEIRVEVLEVAA
jgi:Holliday junction resolvase RusA-like endonuclease